MTHTRLVVLKSGGDIQLTGTFNPLTLSKRDRQFIMDLVDLMEAYRPVPKDAREPAQAASPEAKKSE